MATSLDSEPVHSVEDAALPSSTSAHNSSSDESLDPTDRPSSRPKLGSRKSSGTMIIPRDSPRVEMKVDDEEYGDDDVRNMSPRRSMDAVEKLGEDARQNLMEQAQTLQRSLSAIVDRIEVVKEEHEKLEGGNKFLQS